MNKKFPFFDTSHSKNIFNPVSLINLNSIRDFEKIEFRLEKGRAIIIDKKLLIQQPEKITGNYLKNLNLDFKKVLQI